MRRWSTVSAKQIACDAKPFHIDYSYNSIDRLIIVCAYVYKYIVTTVMSFIINVLLCCIFFLTNVFFGNTISVLQPQGGCGGD